MSFSYCSQYFWSHLSFRFLQYSTIKVSTEALPMKYCNRGLPDTLQPRTEEIFRNCIKFVASDTTSLLKYDIMIDDIREVLFRPFRAREGCAAENAWEQRRNGTNRR